MNLNRLYHNIFLILFFGFSIKSCDKINDNTKNKICKPTIDSISIWIKSSKNKSYSINDRKQFLIKSYTTIKSSQIDSTKTRNLSSVAYQNLKLGDTNLFRKQNKELVALSKTIKDTFSLGDAHWNYASYYNKIQVYDSAYYHFNIAHSYFDKGGYIFESAQTQYGMAFIRGRFRDYSGSEVLTFKAIEKFKKIKNYKSLHSCYDHLGQLEKDIKEYDRALFYYNLALGYAYKTNNNQKAYDASQNNIANIYVKQGNYTKALSYYNNVLDNNNLKLQNIEHYARALDNKSYCKLLMRDTIGVHKSFNEALNIRENLNNKEGIVISKIHLAQFYIYRKDTSSAINFIKEANILANQIKNSRDYLETLLLLAKLDRKNSSKYLKEHISFSDSLQIVDRKIQNKFTRIAYQTDEYIEETKRLSQQKVWIIITSFGLLSILGLLYFLKIQTSKNEKLRLENEQQKANEQIYLITLKQQEKLEKEKVKERNRISEELHDGILGKLFGTRVGLGFLNISSDKATKEQHQAFLKELQIIEKEIRDVSHKLSDNFDSTQINFITIIQQMLIKKSKISNFKYELQLDDHINWAKVNEVVKVNLYRILQEAIQNIIKHASAKQIIIAFNIKKEKLVMLVQDDGKGFNLKRKLKGIGIKNMKSRSHKINGELQIKTVKNKGTKLEVLINLK